MAKKSSIVRELQQLASDEDVAIPALLRKALIVATKLGLEDFKSWILSEIEGYPDEKKVPDYRIVRSDICVENPFRGLQPFIVENSELSEQLVNIPFICPIAELATLVSGDRESTTLKVSFTQQTMLTLMRAAKTDLTPFRIIDRSKITSILETIRTTVLKWSLRLEQEGILGEGMAFSGEEKEKAKTSDSVHIENYGIWGNVQAQNVQIGDYASIHNQLKKAGVSQQERNELEKILDELKATSGEKHESIVQRGMDWVNRNKVLIGNLGQLIIRWLNTSSNSSG